MGGARECVNYVGDYRAERVVSHLGFQVTMEELGETWQQQQQQQQQQQEVSAYCDPPRIPTYETHQQQTP